MKLFFQKLSVKIGAISIQSGLRNYVPHLLLVIYGLVLVGFFSLSISTPVEDQSASQSNELRATFAPLRETAAILAIQAASLSPGRAVDQAAFRAADEAHKRALENWASSPAIASLTAHPAATQALQSFAAQQRRFRKHAADIFDIKKSFDAAFSTLPLSKRELALALTNEKSLRHEDVIASIDSTHQQVKDLLLLADEQRSTLMLENLAQRRARLALLAPAISGQLKAVFDKLALLLKTKQGLESQVQRLEVAKLDQLAEELITTLSALDSQLHAQDKQDKQVSSTMSALLLFLGLASIFGLYFALLNKKRAGLAEDTALGTIKDAQNIADKSGEPATGFDALVAAKAEATDKIVSTPCPLNSGESSRVRADTQLEALKQKGNQTEVAREICQQLDTPLAAIEKNIEMLCPILSEVHEAFDHIDQQPGLRKLAPGIAALNDAGSITEIPFLVADIQEGLRSARKVTQNVASLVTHPNESLEVLELNQLLKAVLRSKADDLGIGTGVKLKLAPEPVEIMANPSRMRHALECLISNAAEAIKTSSVVGGLIELHTSSQNERVKFTIRDNGCGMERETLEKIFEPFYSTKKHKPGAGMGLAYVKAHVEQVGGKVDIVSNPNKGTMARLSFPVVSHEMNVEREHRLTSTLAVEHAAINSQDQRQVKELSLNALVEDVVRRKHSEISAKTTLSLGLAKEAVELKAVPVDIRFLVANLIDGFLARARAKAKQTSTLRITTQRKTEFVVLTVRDNAKLNGSKTASSLASGLSQGTSCEHDLTRVSKIVSDYNGRIDVANTSDGGTIVRISLPKDRLLAEITQDIASSRSSAVGNNVHLQAQHCARPSAEVISLGSNASNDNDAAKDNSPALDEVDRYDDEERYGDEGVVPVQDKQWLTLV